MSRFIAKVKVAVNRFAVTFALIDQSTPNYLTDMLQVSFEVNRKIRCVRIAKGDIMMMIAQYWSAKATMIWTLKRNGISKLS